MVPFESTLERDFLSLASGWPTLVRIDAQPITVSWFDGTRWRRYTPDFRIELSAVPENLHQFGFETTTYVEVKYSTDVENDRSAIHSRLEAVRSFTNQPAVIADETFIRRVLR